MSASALIEAAEAEVSAGAIWSRRPSGMCR